MQRCTNMCYFPTVCKALYQHHADYPETEHIHLLPTHSLLDRCHNSMSCFNSNIRRKVIKITVWDLENFLKPLQYRSQTQKPARASKWQEQQRTGANEVTIQLQLSCCHEKMFKPNVARFFFFFKRSQKPPFLCKISLFWNVGNKLKGKKQNKTKHYGGQIKHNCRLDLTCQPPVCNLVSRSPRLTQFIYGNSRSGLCIHWHKNCNETLKLD